MNITTGRGVVEGMPMVLGPTLSVVPVLGWDGSRGLETPGSVSLEPLALILARPDGTARLVLGDAGAYPDLLRPRSLADHLDEATRQVCVDAVFGPLRGSEGSFRLPFRRALGEVTSDRGDPHGFRIEIRSTEPLGEVAFEGGRPEVQPAL